MQPNLRSYVKRMIQRSSLLALILFVASYTIQAQTPQHRLQIQQKSNLKDLISLINVFTAKYKSEEAEVVQYLRTHPGVKRMFVKNGSVYYLKRISKEGMPVYINTKNRASGEMIGANQLYAGGSVGANVTGTGMIGGVWDLGQVRATHELLSGKGAQQAGQPKSSATGNDHMTHVTGTMVGKDIPQQPSARGIAYDATAQNYDDDNDAAEMAGFAASGYLISNHSYGYANDNTTPVWQYGAYDTDSRGYDIVAKNAPFYLPFVAAGNEQQSSGNPTKNGYDIITGASAAKNVITVGALNGDSTMSDYSNWGPTDDGRFKPEVVAKGTGINSSTYTSDNSYSGNGESSSGTSYASPAVAATGLLLQQYYRNLTTTSMRSSTLRGLMMHTAFDLGNPGPDYKFGWGLLSADKAGNLIKQAKASTPPQGSSITEYSTNPANNGTDEMVINVVAGGTAPLKVSISWTDDEGPEQTQADGVDPTTGRLIYHFDVLVRNTATSAETRPWRPMGMTNRTSNATKGSAWFEGDNNNYRQVLIENPVANTTYAIVIRKSTSSPADVRPFSLIVSGMRVSLITDHFRTKQSGNWNNVGTWESSPDGTTWIAATLTPDFNSNTITIQNTHAVTVTANVTTDQTTVNTGGSLIVNPSIVLSVNNGAGNDLAISTGATMTVRSTATGTASIGNSSGNITGNVTIERYTSDKRAWRLLGIPFSSSPQSIKAAWQEGATTVASNPTPGYGTHITTYLTDPNAANFDAQRPGSSIRIYAADNFNSDAAHTPNTTNNITGNQAYFLFVRGDRSVDRTIAAAPSSATTLRISGTIKQGTLTDVGVPGTNFNLIQNPYPSAIDFDAVKGITANAGINRFYVWDASLGTVGQYRTIDISGSGPNYTYTATPGGANNNWRYIESGTAFMVPGNNTLVNFTEAVKTGSTPPSGMLRIVSGNETEIVVNLYKVNTDNIITLADGVREVFSNTYAAGVDSEDAKKIPGFELDLGIVNKDDVLSVEKRPLPNQNDVIYLKLTNAAPGNYQFEIQPANFPSALQYAYLRDNYLDTYTTIDLTANTKINFTITADAASAAANRYSILFTKNPVLTTKPAIVIYPNPVQNGIITLKFTDLPKGVYTIKLLNILGQAIITKQIEHPGGSGIQTINVNKIKGTYMLEFIKPDNSKQANKIIIN